MKQIIIDNISTTYYITEDGKCYNNITNKYLKGQVGKNGYLSFSLTMPDGSKKRVYAHRLVGEAYVPKASAQQKQINHIDGNKLNNYASNLEWVTAKENQQHALSCDLRRFPHVFCFNRDKILVAEYKSIPMAAKAVGISESIIGQELRKEVKTLSGGFYWSRERTLGKIKDYTSNGKAKRVNQYDLKGKYIATYESAGQAGRALGAYSGSHVAECCRGKIKTYKGFIWRYVDDIVSPLSEELRETQQNVKEKGI